MVPCRDEVDRSKLDSQMGQALGNIEWYNGPGQEETSRSPIEAPNPAL